MRNFFLLFFLIGLISCTHVRYGLDADFSTAKNQGHISYEASQDLTALAWSCWLTSPILGGACWGYLFLPMGEDEFDITARAREFVEAELSDTITEFAVYSIEKLAYESGDPDALISLGTGMGADRGISNASLSEFERDEQLTQKDAVFNHTGFRFYFPTFGLAYEVGYGRVYTTEIAYASFGYDKSYWLDMKMSLLEDDKMLLRSGLVLGSLETNQYAGNVYGLSMELKSGYPLGLLAMIFPRQKPTSFRCRESSQCSSTIDSKGFLTLVWYL